LGRGAFKGLNGGPGAFSDDGYSLSKRKNKIVIETGLGNAGLQRVRVSSDKPVAN
jgi:hypothetical protein